MRQFDGILALKWPCIAQNGLKIAEKGVVALRKTSPLNFPQVYRSIPLGKFQNTPVASRKKTYPSYKIRFPTMLD